MVWDASGTSVEEDTVTMAALQDIGWVVPRTHSMRTMNTGSRSLMHGCLLFPANPFCYAEFHCCHFPGKICLVVSAVLSSYGTLWWQKNALLFQTAFNQNTACQCTVISFLTPRHTLSRWVCWASFRLLCKYQILTLIWSWISKLCVECSVIPLQSDPFSTSFCVCTRVCCCICLCVCPYGS